LPKALDLASVERWAIERALSLARGNKAEAARLLGIGRRTLYDKLGGA
jgi:DNA-binding NtrC family response regulator